MAKWGLHHPGMTGSWPGSGVCVCCLSDYPLGISMDPTPVWVLKILLMGELLGPWEPSWFFFLGDNFRFSLPLQPFWLPTPGSASQRDHLDQRLYRAPLKYRAVQKNRLVHSLGGIFHDFFFCPIVSGEEARRIKDQVLTGLHKGITSFCPSTWT
jgi:hypothetical protein